MCTNKAVTCPKVTIGFSTLLMLGMIISLAVINSMFGDNMECYATATDTNSDGRRKMSTDMNYFAAQNPIGDDFARVKLSMSNIAKSVGLAPYMKQLPFARDNVRRLAGAPPNDDSCDYANDGTCDDGGSGTTWYAPCDCGTDVSDCGVNRNAADCIAAPPPPPYSWGSSNAKTAAASQAGRDKVEKVRPPPTLQVPLSQPFPFDSSCVLLPTSCLGRAWRDEPVDFHSCHTLLALPDDRQRADPSEGKLPTVRPRLLYTLPCTLHGHRRVGTKGRPKGGGGGPLGEFDQRSVHPVPPPSSRSLRAAA